MYLGRTYAATLEIFKCSALKLSKIKNNTPYASQVSLNSLLF